MWRTIISCVILGGLLGISCGLLVSRTVCAEEHFFDGVVERVLSGDTVILRGGTVIKYMGITSPDAMSEQTSSIAALAQKAQAFNKQMVEKKPVRIELVPLPEGADASRTYAYVFVGGQMINAVLLKKGLAVISSVTPPDEKYSDYFTRLQQSAVTTRQGVWALVDATRKT